MKHSNNGATTDLVSRLVAGTLLLAFTVTIIFVVMPQQ